jgi:hypothetical protein
MRSGHSASLGDVDAIEELTVVLTADLADLANLGTWKRDVLVINAFKDELVLKVGVELHCGTGEKLNFLDLFSSEEVLDFNRFAILRDGYVDGEVSVHESHLVSISIDGTVDHVADEWLKGWDGAALLCATEPHLDVQIKTLSLLGLLLLNAHLNWHVFEALGDLTSGTLDLDLSGLDCDSDILRNLNPILNENSSHLSLYLLNN